MGLSIKLCYNNNDLKIKKIEPAEIRAEGDDLLVALAEEKQITECLFFYKNNLGPNAFDRRLAWLRIKMFDSDAQHSIRPKKKDST